MNYRDISGATILLLLRNGEAKDWPSLCRVFQLHPRITHRTEHYMLRKVLTDLRSAGLVEFDPGSLEFEADEQSSPTRIMVSENWRQIQGALDISLSKVARLSRGNSMVVDPFFGLPNKKKVKSADVFILMPFQERLKPVYDDHIKAVTRKLAISVSRADDLFGAGAVMSDIWTSICAAKVIVADCTDRNPNVLYEVGLAHVVGKPVIFITQNRADVPFDIQHVRYIKYKYTPPGMRTFEKQLTETLKAILDQH